MESDVVQIEYRADPLEMPSRMGIFLHGMLVGEGVERSALQCACLLQAIVTLGRIRVVMPEFDRLFARGREEPTSLELGPVSRPVLSEFQRLTESHPRVPVIAYSYGAVILAKLLGTELADRVGAIALVAPVVTWIQDAWTAPLSTLPALVLSGTHDRFAQQEDVLKRWFPQGRFCHLHGANHLYYLMPSPMDRYDEQPGILSREEQIRRTAENVVAYLGIPLRADAPGRVHLVEITPAGERDLTDEFRRKMRRGC